MRKIFRSIFARLNLLVLVFVNPKYRVIACATLAILIIGTVFYHFVEGWSWVDSIYFCVVALATVGFGDLTPSKDVSKIFTIVYLITGLGIFLAFLNAIFGEIKDIRAKEAEEKNDKNN